MFDVVIPLYNKERYIADTIGCVLAQSYRDFQIIVVDDGSTDNGVTIVEAIADPRIKIVRQDNQGIGNARNTGIASGSSPWVAFLDADDLWYPNHLAELNYLRERFPYSGLIATSFVMSRDLPLSPPAQLDFRRQQIDYLAEASRNVNAVHTSSVAVPRRLDPKFISSLGEDLELWVRIALHHSVARSGRITAGYRLGTGGVMDTTNDSLGSTELTLAGISPSVATALSALPSIDQAKKKSAIAYINGRVSAVVKMALVQRNWKQARKVAALYIRPRGWRVRFLRVVCNLPTPVLQTLRALRR